MHRDNRDRKKTFILASDELDRLSRRRPAIRWGILLSPLR